MLFCSRRPVALSKEPKFTGLDRRDAALNITHFIHG